MQRADGTVTELPSKVPSLRIAKGDVFRLTTAGGGGFGEPARRSQDAIRADIENGYITPEAALKDYGWRG